MDVVGEGARAAATGDGGSGGFIHSVVGFSSANTPLLFWLLTVALVTAIHVASGYMSPSSFSPSGEDKETTEKRPRLRGGFPGDDERESEADRHDDRVLQMMRSFSFVHASEEDFMEGMAMYQRAFDDDGAPSPEPVASAAPPPAAPDSPPSLSFSFQHQIPEIPRVAAAVPRAVPVQEERREKEQEKESPIPVVPLAKHEHRDEAEETEVVMEEHEEEDEAEEIEPKIVPVTHNYRFLTERDFRGFVREPETMTVRVLESFVPPPQPQPVAAQPEERRVVDMASRRGGFVTVNDFLPVIKPVVRDTVASSLRNRAPSRRRKSATSPSVASRGSGGRASEFSGFGDSDSNSSGNDGYSVKELVVDSDSDWFVSEKDFPASALDAARLRSYKLKLLKAMESVEEADTPRRSFRDSAPAASPASVVQASPDSIKYPADLWSRSPSPDAEYKVDEDKDMEGEGSSIDVSDDEDGDERSWSSTKMVAAPVYDVDSAAEDSSGEQS